MGNNNWVASSDFKRLKREQYKAGLRAWDVFYRETIYFPDKSSYELVSIDIKLRKTKRWLGRWWTGL